MVQNGENGGKSDAPVASGAKNVAEEPAKSAGAEKAVAAALEKKSGKKTEGSEPSSKSEPVQASGAIKTPTSTATTTTAVDEDCGGDDEDCGSDDQEGDPQIGNDDASDQSHNDPGKMFIGGLSWQTSAEGLRDYFCKFGDVNECMVMRDPATKRARGFGFITFADPISVERVLAEECHQLDGKKIDPKVAFPKRQQPKMVVKTKKVFIGGLSATSTLEDMKHYFQQYGKIEDAMLMFDKTTQRHRGFGFITFDDDDISDKVCEIHFHEINGKMVECKKAQPKEVMLPVQMNKSRAAAARNYYGIAPEQLLAYASYMPNIPRLGPYSNPGMLFPTTLFNGFPQSFGLSGTSSRNTSGGHHHGALNGGNGAGGSALAGNGGAGLINPRNLAAVQLAAQQQAVYEAAMAYATSMSSLGSSGGAGGTSSAAATSGGVGGGESSAGSSAPGQLHPATVAAAAVAAAAAAVTNQQPPHHQQPHHHQRQPLHQAQVVVTTHHHHLQHAQMPPHHMHTVSAQQGHHPHHQQQQAGPPPLHHQHSAGGSLGTSALHHHHLHHQQPQMGQPQAQQSSQQPHQRPPLLPTHFPPHKM